MDLVFLNILVSRISNQSCLFLNILVSRISNGSCPNYPRVLEANGAHVQEEPPPGQQED